MRTCVSRLILSDSEEISYQPFGPVV
jgi:hypothetical protein